MTSVSSRVRLTQMESNRLVNRLKNTNLDKFRVICKMHLCFLLHLPGSSLEEFLNDGAQPISAAASGHVTQQFSTPSEKHKFRYFGKKKCNKEMGTINHQPITQEVINQILPLIDYLNKDANIKQEGLFRKSGHLGRQKVLREKLHSGDDVKSELQSGVYCAHDCASVLKGFLSELPEPILTEKHYKAHCQIPEMKLVSKQLQTLQLLLQLLPPKNLFLLHRLLLLLHKVAQEPANKMSSDNLGTLFAPHLLMPRQMSASELQMVASDMSKMVTFMIDNVDELFKLPQPVIRDIATYWSQMEQCSARSVGDDVDRVKLEKLDRSDSSDPPIYTSITFADRQASRQAATETDTQMALAQLYAHVSAMPSSSKKRRLLKQFTKSSTVSRMPSPPSTAEKCKKPKLLSDSIKKIVTRNHRRHGSCQSLLVDRKIQELANMPLAAAENKTKACCARVINFPSSPCVHIVDIKENQDPNVDNRLLMDSSLYRSSPMASKFSLPLMNHHRLDSTPRQHATKKHCHQRARYSPVRSTPDSRFERPIAFVSPITRTFNNAPLMTKTNIMTPRSRAPMAFVTTP